MTTRPVALLFALALLPRLTASQSPDADGFRSEEAKAAKNRVAAAQDMPADKYAFKPTPAQMSFADITLHLAEGNDFFCGAIGGMKAPARTKLAATAPRDQLVTRLTETFDFCGQALAKLDDSRLAEELPFFGGKKMTRAAMMIVASDDWGDHYSQAAIYMRLNGVLPPTAKKPAPEPAAAQKLTGPHPSGAIPAPVLLDTTGLFRDRYAKVGDDLFISGQPTERGLRELKRQGVTTIVNLRTPEEMAAIGFDEVALAKELGMSYVYLPVRGNAQYPYSPATLSKFTEAMTGTQGKVLLHCTIAWRASHLWGAYLIAERGVPDDAALANARTINLMDDMRMSDGRDPIEQFLDRPVPGLLRGRKP